ncbi:HNH endonuclease [Priestia megaterium]|uniref:HNH endonuclease n=1 Tax=Priestia megaterium TaxID=1404 RepID=UPI00203C32B8|nr:HNH endonuclease [Priestia megaterium]MCM3186372.1 hypothetical protein [Priestia megaterium]
MTQLDKRRIDFVIGLSTEVHAKVLYEFLKKGTSTREIEKIIDDLAEKDGWQSWSIIHFYGFDKYSKAKFPSLTLKSLRENLNNSFFKDLNEFHNNNLEEGETSPTIIMNENDGKDVFRIIKTRQGQQKLRKLLLSNYKSKCALCNISDSRLLITSHIKTWAKSSYEERVDPTNSILFCKIHDGLFENGLISLTDDYEIIFSPDFGFENQGISTNLTFTEPQNSPPSTIFLKEHRLKHGYE